MTINTNRWNRIRYTLYTPFYNVISGLFRNARQNSIEGLDIQEGEKVLLIGAGTGLDLEFLPRNCEITATDLTPSMVSEIRTHAQQLDLPVRAVVMDGQALDSESSVFDKVILHLILAVIPDPVACIKETERVLKPGGRVAVFDKFVQDQEQISVTRRVANVFTSWLFSDITRSIEAIVGHTSLKIVSNKDGGFKGNFRLIILEKPYVSEAEFNKSKIK